MNMEKKPMLRSTPEREGIPSGAIEKYMRALVDAKLAMHSVMIVRHRKVVFESYFKPFDENFQHRLYSCSKSIVSLTIGYLAEKGLIDLDDKCIKYFDKKIRAEEDERDAKREAARQLRMEEAKRHALEEKNNPKPQKKEKAVEKKKNPNPTNEAGRVGERPYARGRSYVENRYDK